MIDRYMHPPQYAQDCIGLYTSPDDAFTKPGAPLSDAKRYLLGSVRDAGRACQNGCKLLFFSLKTAANTVNHNSKVGAVTPKH